ncbi:putative transcription elongation factor TFIIS [Bodo saltans virus]|jgi:DNA-directed RNA polymerase subunit M/transcription elongation factor TFIIS|uniref:Transcription elongation factor TFIIS n=1 Tax=Bodo saltans virus TaxID=2024608 RepID=A0A2H4UUW2_9VIRU|nr:putative transcription elongation factor TFIIS [Bodo saltans virus]ATZ80710.1 putative transcription elongation factor TFIIS [Bodo saltans virus]
MECPHEKHTTLTIDKSSLENDHRNRYNFYMKNSSDISFNLLREAENTINRNNALYRINKLVQNELISANIEKGLFEFALLHVSLKKLEHSRVASIYEFKLHTICINLDINNEHIENKTLLYSILNGELQPYIIAFLSPQQLHHKRWETIMQKKMREDDAMYNVETTDEYECPNCKERKCTVDYIQLRSADEPANKFIVCTVCGRTVNLQ